MWENGAGDFDEGKTWVGSGDGWEWVSRFDFLSRQLSQAKLILNLWWIEEEDDDDDDFGRLFNIYLIDWFIILGYYDLVVI